MRNLRNILIIMGSILGIGVLAGGLGMLTPGKANADDLTAFAGRDRAFPGPSPATVHFNGQAYGGHSEEGYTCQWFNQWQQLRSEECVTDIQVNFGDNNPEPGTTRSFRLVVTDFAGNTAEDWVKYTLTQPGELERDPAWDHGMVGTAYTYEHWGCGVYGLQTLVLGELDDGRWYISSFAGNEDCGLFGYHAIAECHQGQRWTLDASPDGLEAEGCVGDGPAMGELLLIQHGDGGWIVIDADRGQSLTHQKLATLTPRI